MSHTHNLTSSQVLNIAEKYGAFEFGDAQGDKRLAYAADVIVAHERVRDAAPVLLQALIDLETEFRKIYPIYYYSDPWAHDRNLALKAAQQAIAKATEAK
jgi:hypothetical protein